MTKKELRNIFRQQREALTAVEKAKADDLLLIQLQKAKIPFIHTLLSYWPIEANKEPNTHLFTDYIEFQNPELIVAYTKTDFSTNTMIAIATDEDTEFKKNDYNIYEPTAGDEVLPEAIDVIFVPLLAVDKKGYRVGYGKGFYDRYLMNCRKDCLKIGFSYFEPVDSITDTDEFDVTLNLCITPQSIYVF
jgi:5-formyltetrahydrofolate cyclo-ligase